MIAHGVPGIDIRQDYNLLATPAAVFDALTAQLDQWWPVTLRLTGPQGRLHLAPELGALLSETGPNRTGAIWGQVDLIEPARRLYLNGWFGVPGVVMGRVQFDLQPSPQGCALTLTHQAVGPVPEDRVARQRQIWREVLGTALRAHLTGTAV